MKRFSFFLSPSNNKAAESRAQRWRRRGSGQLSYSSVSDVFTHDERTDTEENAWSGTKTNQKLGGSQALPMQESWSVAADPGAADDSRLGETSDPASSPVQRETSKKSSTAEKEIFRLPKRYHGGKTSDDIHSIDAGSLDDHSLVRNAKMDKILGIEAPHAPKHRGEMDLHSFGPSLDSFDHTMVNAEDYEIPVSQLEHIGRNRNDNILSSLDETADMAKKKANNKYTSMDTIDDWKIISRECGRQPSIEVIDTIEDGTTTQGELTFGTQDSEFFLKTTVPLRPNPESTGDAEQPSNPKRRATGQLHQKDSLFDKNLNKSLIGGDEDSEDENLAEMEVAKLAASKKGDKEISKKNRCKCRIEILISVVVVILFLAITVAIVGAVTMSDGGQDASAAVGQRVGIPLTETEETQEPTASPTLTPTHKPAGRPVASTPGPSLAPISQEPTKRPVAPSDPARSPPSSPSRHPSAEPTTWHPSISPTQTPSSGRSSFPTSSPVATPSFSLSYPPSPRPFRNPTLSPTLASSSRPSLQRSALPTNNRPSLPPSLYPFSQPSPLPSGNPTASPTVASSGRPSLQRSTRPTNNHSVLPPSLYPSSQPSPIPSGNPTASPTLASSSRPSLQRSARPTDNRSSPPPLLYPSSQPSPLPSGNPTASPTLASSSRPSLQRSTRPTNNHSVLPSAKPSASHSTAPSSLHSQLPTRTTYPTGTPSLDRSGHPSSVVSNVPTQRGSYLPSASRSTIPSVLLSISPSDLSVSPSDLPSQQPSKLHVEDSLCALNPICQSLELAGNCCPTIDGVYLACCAPRPSKQPIVVPSGVPTPAGYLPDTAKPPTSTSSIPTSFPSRLPSPMPTTSSSGAPSRTHTETPSQPKSTLNPTVVPSRPLSSTPTSTPSTRPDVFPSFKPTSSPSSSSSSAPTERKPTQSPSVPHSATPTEQMTRSPLPTQKPTVSAAPTVSARPSSEVKARIVLAAPLSTRLALKDPSSYQSQALAQLETMDASTVSYFDEEQAFALLAFASQLQPSGLQRRDRRHLSASTWPESGPNYCRDWVGVFCTADGKVSAVNVSQRRLTGQLVEELVMLKDSLMLFDATNNELKGEIPAAYGQLSRLRWFRVSQNKLSGNIPETFVNLENLEHLSVHRNELSGDFPNDVLANMRVLSNLRIYFNNLTGQINSAMCTKSLGMAVFQTDCHLDPNECTTNCWKRT